MSIFAVTFWLATGMIILGPLAVILWRRDGRRRALTAIFLLLLTNFVLAWTLRDPPGAVLEGHSFAVGLFGTLLVAVVGFVATVATDLIVRLLARETSK